MQNTVISEDLTIEGDLVAKQTHLTISGKVTGDVTAKTVEVQSSGTVTGNLTATDVTIGGAVKGQIACDGLTLQETAKVEADIKTGSLSSTKGAALTGKIQVTGG